MAGSKRQLALWISSVVNLCLLVTFSGIRGDVPDDVVWTELHKDVRIGARAVLTCRFQGSPLAVYWKKGYDPRRSPNLVSWIPTDDATGECQLHTVCEIMKMNENYSLIIKDVGISEQGRYICRVANYKGNIIQNFTDVSLYAPPEETYPVIDECINRSSVSNPEPCRVPTNKTITLTCSVTNYYPYIKLFFLHGTKQMTTIHNEEQTNVDSTKSMSISIEASPSETLYTCVASDVPGSKERKAASVLVGSSLSIPAETIPVTVETMKEGIPVTIAVIIAISNVLLGAAVVLYIWHVWWKRRQRWNRRMNPARGKDFDDILKTIADKVVSRKEIYDLGMALGFGPEDIDRYVEENKRETGVSFMGTLSMLRRWRKKQTKHTELKALQTALEKAGQIHLAAELFDLENDEPESNPMLDDLENDEPESNPMLDGVKLSATCLETQQTSIRRREGTLWMNPALERDFDDILGTVADKVASRKEIDDLGMALGFGPEDIGRYVEENKRETGVSYMGTLSMLRRWRNNQTENTELEALQTALEKADQIHLAAELFGE